MIILFYNISKKIANIEKDTNLFVSKAFWSWKYVINFIKRYVIIKGYRIWISDSEKVDKITNKVLK